MQLDEVLRIFRLFSDRTRLRIFLLLLDSELCVGELMALLQLEQSLLSHQLRKLRLAGLVMQQRKGRWIYYRLPASRRKQLEPLFREWLKEELAISGQKAKAIKEKQVCLIPSSRTGRVKAKTRTKGPAGLKGRKIKKN